MRYVDRVTEGGRLKVDVLVVDIDDVTIEETPILEWCMTNLIKEGKWNERVNPKDWTVGWRS